MTADRDGATEAGAAVDVGGVASPDDLVVSEVFGPTFQGEGPSTGRRAAFVRLGRCNLTCTWCDTPYTWDWERFDPSVELSRRTVADLLADIEAMAPEIVVVTGGEPLLQQRRLVPLVAACAERGWSVEVEIKVNERIPYWLTELVAAHNLSLFRISKYCRSIELAENMPSIFSRFALSTI